MQFHTLLLICCVDSLRDLSDVSIPVVRCSGLPGLLQPPLWFRQTLQRASYQSIIILLLPPHQPPPSLTGTRGDTRSPRRSQDVLAEPNDVLANSSALSPSANTPCMSFCSKTLLSHLPGVRNSSRRREKSPALCTIFITPHPLAVFHPTVHRD